MLDFAYTSDVLNNNIELLEIDLKEVEGMILSHGHLDHWGGLPGFLQKHRASMRSDLPLYLGGEDAFRRCVARGPGGAISPFGTLDRKELATARLRLMVSETPQVIDGHAFTTGVVPRKSIERVLPNSQVIFGVARWRWL